MTPTFTPDVPDQQWVVGSKWHDFLGCKYEVIEIREGGACDLRYHGGGLQLGPGGGKTGVFRYAAGEKLPWLLPGWPS